MQERVESGVGNITSTIAAQLRIKGRFGAADAVNKAVIAHGGCCLRVRIDALHHSLARRRSPHGERASQRCAASVINFAAQNRALDFDVARVVVAGQQRIGNDHAPIDQRDADCGKADQNCGGEVIQAAYHRGLLTASPHPKPLPRKEGGASRPGFPLPLFTGGRGRG